MMSPLLQLLGILAVIGIFVIVLLRPAGALAVLLAVGIVAAAIVVSWRDVEHHRQRRAVAEASQQAISAAEAAAAAANAPGGTARAGS